MMNKEEYNINLDHYIEITQREYNNLKQKNIDLQQRIDKVMKIIQTEKRLMGYAIYDSCLLLIEEALKGDADDE